MPTLGVYLSAFNVVQNGLSYEGPIRDALAFFDHVTIAVNTSVDDTLARFQALAEVEPRLKIVTTDIPYTDVTFDGRVKDAALQACEGEVLTQLDLDETIPLNQRDMWRAYAAKLLDTPGVDCFMIPTIDLWGSMETIRADAAIGMKFRMHRRGLHRGVWKRAWVVPGKQFRTDMSDSCELLTPDNELVRAGAVVPPQFLQPMTHSMLNGYPFTVHLGFVSFDQRIKVNKAIWADHWRLRAGGADPKVALDKDSLLGYPLIKHSLNLT
jgi:hypothetical protein